MMALLGRCKPALPPWGRCCCAPHQRAAVRRAPHRALRPVPHATEPRRCITCKGSKEAGPAAAAAAGQAPLEHQTLAQAARMEVEVKKSKFICTAWPVTSAARAMELIRGASDPDASHNCFAYKVGQEFRSSDDGEPGGSAGRPMLAAIEGEGLDGVAVLVTRYYGGTALGVGGLVRAYGGCVRDTLRAAPKEVVRARTQLRFSLEFKDMGPVFGLLAKHGAERLGEEYEGGGARVCLTVGVDVAAADALAAAVSDATSGKVVASKASEPLGPQ